MRIWENQGWLRFGVAVIATSNFLFSAVSEASVRRTARPVILRPLPKAAKLLGDHRSNCAPTTLDGKLMYSRLEIRFGTSGAKGGRYSSEETVYSDPRCEISVFKTATTGKWKSRDGTVLTLLPKKIRFTPLDPRIADAMDLRRACGKSWQNGEARDVTRTECGKERIAQYFMSRGKGQTIELFECEGKMKPDESCARYALSPVRLPKMRPSAQLLEKLRAKKKAFAAAWR
jgi:hypothetical protein